jgi:hypothetical protein
MRVPTQSGGQGVTRWYRAYEGTVTDAKLGEVALVACCSRSVAIAAWHAILESCASVNDSGEFDITPRRAAVILGEPIPTLEAVFAEMRSLGMIDERSVMAWQRRQFESDSSTERSRRHRQRHATLHERDATPPDTDTDTEVRDANASLVGEAPPPIDLRDEMAKRRLAENRAKLRDLGERWNSVAGELHLPTIEEIEPGSTRERQALARLREGRDFERAFAKIRASPFLRGDRGRTPCKFDWITKSTNFVKIIEGNYDDEVRKTSSGNR